LRCATHLPRILPLLNKAVGWLKWKAVCKGCPSLAAFPEGTGVPADPAFSLLNLANINSLTLWRFRSLSVIV
jgi:hypothetical protein